MAGTLSKRASPCSEERLGSQGWIPARYYFLPVFKANSKNQNETSLKKATYIRDTQKPCKVFQSQQGCYELQRKVDPAPEQSVVERWKKRLLLIA